MILTISGISSFRIFKVRWMACIKSAQMPLFMVLEETPLVIRGHWSLTVTDGNTPHKSTPGSTSAPLCASYPPDSLSETAWGSGDRRVLSACPKNWPLAGATNGKVGRLAAGARFCSVWDSWLEATYLPSCEKLDTSGSEFFWYCGGFFCL